MSEEIFLSVVIPVYNSQNTIHKTVIDVSSELRKLKLKHEFVLVNDGSIDDSDQVCRNIVSVLDCVKYVNLSKNFGQHNAILTGLEYAVGAYVLFMDDDLQTPTTEISKLINEIISTDKDVIFGQYECKKHSLFRNFGSSINELMAEKLIEKPLEIKMTSFFIIKAYVANEMKKYSGPYPYLGGLIFRVTNNVGNVKIEHQERKFGKSNYTFKKLLKLLINGFTNFSVVPLRLCGLVGIVLSVVGFVLAIFLTIRKLVNPNIILGWTSIVVIIIFLGGVQLLSLGIIGEYIGRIYLTLNGKPQSVVKEVVISEKTSN